MPNQDDLAERRRIAVRFISGCGVEIGAGLDPVTHPAIRELAFIDKRDRAELEKLFGRPVPYRVLTLEQSLGAGNAPADFIMAHHVVEHCPNPIRQIGEWLPLLGPTGRVFFSVPSDTNSGEKGRVPTHASHVLHDFLFHRDGDDFDSKQHIPHFVLQWVAMDPDYFWYTKDGVAHFADRTLAETRRDGHDLHWHTYTLEVFCQTIEAAFWFAGLGLRWLHRDTACNAHYVVAERAPIGEPPKFLGEQRAELVKAAARLPH